MPVFDRFCPTCEWERPDNYEHSCHETVLCPNGHETKKVWFPNGVGPSIIPDDIPGGLVVENLGPEPVKVYSKSQLRHEAKMRGKEAMVQHRGTQGGDRSKFTTRWI